MLAQASSGAHGAIRKIAARLGNQKMRHAFGHVAIAVGGPRAAQSTENKINDKPALPQRRPAPDG
jgi:hypothetical protein